MRDVPRLNRLKAVETARCCPDRTQIDREQVYLERRVGSVQQSRVGCCVCEATVGQGWRDRPAMLAPVSCKTATLQLLRKCSIISLFLGKRPHFLHSSFINFTPSVFFPRILHSFYALTFASPSFDSMGASIPSSPRAALQVKCAHQEFDPISPPNLSSS